MRMLEQSSRKRILWHFVAYLLALLGVGGYDSWLLGGAVGGRYGVMDVAPWRVCWLCWQHGNGLCCWCQFGWCHPSQQVFAVFLLWSPEALRMFTAQFFPFAWLLHVPPSLCILFYKTQCLVGAMPPVNGIIVAGIVIVTRIKIYDEDSCRAHFWTEYIQKVCCLCCSQCLSYCRC